MVWLGVDVGATQTKAAVLGERGELLGQSVVKSGVDFGLASVEAAKSALASAGLALSDIKRCVACGYGRHNVPFANSTRTEIACHARGAWEQVRGEFVLVDIGGQDNKVIYIGERGTVTSFKMNRKCAAGTGAFLEEIALRLNVRLEEMNNIAESSDSEVVLGSFCTVFTATEMLAHIRRGVKLEHLVRGAFRSIIKRIMEMSPLEGEVWLSGGVIAHNRVLLQMFAQELRKEVYVVDNPEINGAIGAALYAKEESG